AILSKVEAFKADYESQKNLTTEAQEKLNSLNTYYSEKKDHQFQLSKEIEIKDIQLKSMLSELNKTSEDTSEKSANIEEFKNRLAEISKEKIEKQSVYDQLKASEESLKEQITDAEERISAAREELTKINRTLDARQNEFNLTKSLVDNLEGFPEAIKFLKKNPQWKDAPLLSDVLSCPEEYRISIENFLEPFMNYYIVDSHDDALKAVNLLSESTRGKANFFILENLKQFKSESIPAPFGSKSALELIDYDDKYENLIKHLLWNVYIADNPKRAGEGNVVLLDKEGKVTFRRYSISGGSIGLFEGKRIGRAKNLEKLEVEIKDLKKKQGTYEQSISKYQSQLEELKRSSKAPHLEEVKEELSRIKEVEVSVQTKQDQFIELLTSNKNRREDIQQQIVGLEKALESLKPQAEKERNELLELEGKVEA
ncbi:MAG: chromosome segregation protein SMC, partial [Ekhidna sp.]